MLAVGSGLVMMSAGPDHHVAASAQACESCTISFYHAGLQTKNEHSTQQGGATTAYTHQMLLLVYLCA
jgi:hypothetical protein